MNLSARRTLILLALLCITALAAGLRFYQIDQLPPGLSYDEAWNDLQALRVVQGTLRPVYFVDERRDIEEPLHIYLIAGLFALADALGIAPPAIGGRLVSAFLGTLTIPLLFLATREMLHALPMGPRPQLLSLSEKNRPTAAYDSNVVALIAALALATLYWHVHYTRLGMEPSAVPALAALTFWLLWRAFNRGKWLDYGLTGGALGLSLYTHPSARFLPIVIVLFVVYRWAGRISSINFQISNRASMGREVLHTAWLVACALIVFAPLGIFFLQHPDLFFYRASQASVMTLSGGLQPILDNTVKVMGGLFWCGDTNLRLNLPGRPGLDTVQLTLMIFGVIYALRRERRRVLAFPIVWAGTMILPSVFSDAAPHFGRMLGATPALALLLALGITQITNLKVHISKARMPIGLIAAIAAMGYSTLTMARDYFVTWARDPGLFTAFDVGLRQSAEYLASLPRDELISLSPVDRGMPIFRFTFRDDVERLKTFNGRRCAVYPVKPEHDFTHIAIVAEETGSLQALERAFPSGQIVQTFKSLDRPYAIAYRIYKGELARAPLEGRAVFGLAGKQIILTKPSRLADTSLHAGDTLTLTLAWQSRQPLDVNLTIFVHLAPTPDSPPVAQEDAQPCDNSYPTTWWTPGEIIEEYRRIVIPPGAPPGEYVVTTGIYDLATSQRLPMWTQAESGQTTGDRFVLGTVRITP
jgi:hypothetical protein